MIVVGITFITYSFLGRGMAPTKENVFKPKSLKKKAKKQIFCWKGQLTGLPACLIKETEMERYQLNNGVEIPVLGFGTWKAQDGEEAYQAVLTALEAG